MGLLSSLFGGSKSTTNPSTVFAEQVPFLQNLWQQGQGLQQQQQGQIGQTAFPLAQQLGQQGQGFLQQLQGAGSGLNQFTQTGQPGGIEQQLAALQGLGQFNLGQSLEGITDQGIAAGGIGSARSGLAAGQAAGLSNLGFMGAAGGLLQSDIQRRQQAGIAQAGIGAGAAGQGLSQLGGLYNLGLQPFQSVFNPLQNQANILGRPTVLGGGGSTQTQNPIFNPMSIF